MGQASKPKNYSVQFFEPEFAVAQANLERWARETNQRHPHMAKFLRELAMNWTPPAQADGKAQQQAEAA